MKNYRFYLVLGLAFLMSGCHDDPTEIAPVQVPGPIVRELVGCNTHKFEGIQAVENVRDLSLDINWDHDPDSIGFTVFKKLSNGDFELVKSVNSTTNSYHVRNLTEQTEYQFMVKSIGGNGLHDCNSKILAATTLDRQTFKSCQEIANFYGAGKPSGEYEIDIDLDGPRAPIKVYCEMDRNGGGWTRILVHKTSGGRFANDQDALEKNTENVQAELYSILKFVEDFRRAGKFEFWLHYPELDQPDAGNHWTQTSNPTSSPIAGYQGISVDHSTQRWGGLEKSRSHTLINGSVGHANWFYAIGAKRYWPRRGTIPGPSGGVTEVFLYVR